MQTLKFLLTTSFYPPFHIGGDATHVEYLAQELSRRGHEVHVVHSLDAYRIKRGRQLPRRQLQDQKNVFINALESPFRALDPLMIYVFGSSLWINKKYSEIVREIHPDIVHHHNLSLLGYNLLRKRGNYLSVYTAHDYWLICQTNNLFKNQEEICFEKNCPSCSVRSKRFPQIWRSCQDFKTCIQNIDLLISPSEYVRKRIIREVAARSITLPNFVPPPPNDIPVHDPNYFLFLGMLEKHKGVLHLLELFKEQRHNLRAKLIIAGGGSLRNYIEEYIKKNSLTNLISFLGFVDNSTKYHLYKNALAVIIPSIWPENAPLVALEALSVGTPVITSNKGGLPEIIEKVDKRLIFNNNDELKGIILTFYRDNYPSCERIKRIYEENFSPKAYVDNYIEAIQSI